MNKNSEASAIVDLQHWYYAQSDGDWEHQYGVTIETLDHPGWKVTIDLAYTDMEDVSFEEVQRGEMGHNYEDNLDWFLCRKIDGKFDGLGGPEQLEAILRVFLAWVHSQPEAPLEQTTQ